MNESNKIYSKVDESLICSYVRMTDINEYRTDVSPSEEYMQVSARKLKSGTVVTAHKHNLVTRTTTITQESWVILGGMIRADIYDLDDCFLVTIVLFTGDCITLYRGGHKLTVLDSDTIFYEFKNGPYLGGDIDKTPIVSGE